MEVPVATKTITANGDYTLDFLSTLPRERPFEMGASKTGAGAGATVQLWGEIAGVKTNIDSAQVITNAAPKAWPNRYSPNPRRGVTVSGLNGTDDVLTLEVL